MSVEGVWGDERLLDFYVMSARESLNVVSYSFFNIMPTRNVNQSTRIQLMKIHISVQRSHCYQNSPLSEKKKKKYI